MKPSLKYKQISEIRQRIHDEERANKLKAAAIKKEELAKLVEKLQNETDTNKRYELAEKQLALLEKIRIDEYDLIRARENQEHEERVKKRRAEMNDQVTELLPEFRVWLENELSDAQDSPIELTLPEKFSRRGRDLCVRMIQLCLDELNKDDGMNYHIIYYHDHSEPYRGHPRPVSVEIGICLKNMDELMPFLTLNKQ